MNEFARPLWEINRFEDTTFPVKIYDVTRERILPDGRGYQDLHWHEEAQYTWVARGWCRMIINGTVYSLNEGDGIYINGNVLHASIEMSEDGQYFSVNYPAKLLGFFPGSRMERDLVTPMVNDKTWSVISLKQDVRWQKMILHQLETLKEIYFTPDAEKEIGWQYHLSIILANCWLLLIQNVEHVQETAYELNINLKQQDRAKTMLAFVHAHYMNDIRVKDIAKAAGISEGECSRCFHKMVGYSPKQYLLFYRYLKGRAILISTDLSVTDIAYNVGFGNASRFISYFHSQTGMTPLEFRKSIAS